MTRERVADAAFVVVSVVGLGAHLVLAAYYVGTGTGLIR